MASAANLYYWFKLAIEKLKNSYKTTNYQTEIDYLNSKIEEISFHMTSVDKKWHTLKEQMAKNVFNHKFYLIFEQKVRKLARIIDATIVTTDSLKAEIDGKLNPLDGKIDLLKTQLKINVINAAVNIAALITCILTGNYISVVSFLTHGSFVVYSAFAFKNWYDICFTKKEKIELENQLLVIKMMQCKLNNFRKRFDEMSDWYIENCDKFDSSNESCTKINDFNFEYKSA